MLRVAPDVKGYFTETEDFSHGCSPNEDQPAPVTFEATSGLDNRRA